MSTVENCIVEEVYVDVGQSLLQYVHKLNQKAHFFLLVMGLYEPESTQLVILEDRMLEANAAGAML